MKFIVAFLLSLLLFAAPAGADQLDDGYTAALNGKYQTALRLLQPLADNGNPRAQFYIGTLYMNGEAVKQDDSTAVKWFRKASGQGDTDAATALGIMYENGRGVEKDEGQALGYYLQAAKRGNAKAELIMSQKYAHGDGVDQNEEEAFFWQLLAVKRNPQFSLTEAVASSNHLSPDQIKAAEQRVRDWKPAP